DGIDYRTIRRVGPPFHRPTNVAMAADGSLYVTDGYGNARVHKFDPAGKLQFSWGEPGSGPARFNLPHGLTIDREGLVYVADRETSRVQVFSAEGKFLTQWTDVARPMQVFYHGDHIFVAEVGWKAGLFPWLTSPSPDAPGGRVSVFDRAGRVLSRWGGEGDPCAPGNFFAPHDICLDSPGDIYVGEVVPSS